MGGKGNLLWSMFSCHVDEVPWVLLKAGSHSATGLTLSGPRFQILAQAGGGGIRPPLNSAPLHLN